MSDAPNQVLIDDLARATKNVEQLSAAIEPNVAWRTWSREKQGCFGRTGQIVGYQTKHVRELKAETVGRALEVEAIFEFARQWFPKQNFDIIRDVAFDDGFHEILAINIVGHGDGHSACFEPEVFLILHRQETSPPQ